jgi:hypothetical protein
VIIAACFAEPPNLRGATGTAASFLSEKPKTPQLRYVSNGAPSVQILEYVCGTNVSVFPGRALVRTLPDKA